MARRERVPGMSRAPLDRLDLLRQALTRFIVERDWDQFHSPRNLAVALAVEAGELLEHFQWTTEEQSKALAQDERHAVAEEMADVFLYLLCLAEKIDVNLLEAAERKLETNRGKYPVEKAKGKSTKYTKL